MPTSTPDTGAASSAPTPVSHPLRLSVSPSLRPYVTHTALLLTAAISLFPFFVMLQNSFKSNDEVLRNPAGWPEHFTFDSYRELFNYEGNQVIRAFANSVFIATTSTILAVILAALAAFAFAKMTFRGRDLIFALLLGTLMVPTEVTLPPLYIMFARIHWLNSYQVQIVPSVASVFGLFMIRQYMLSIPNELLEASRLDGANRWQQFWQIVVPISAPVLGAFAILHFIGRWNDYLWPLIVVTDPDVQPIMTLLPTIRDPIVGFLTPWGMVMAGCVIVTIPLVAVFLLFQDKFMSGVVAGATKG